MKPLCCFLFFTFLGLGLTACAASPSVPLPVRVATEESHTPVSSSTALPGTAVSPQETRPPAATRLTAATATPITYEDAYYVATTGHDDMGDGSSELPWATITHAAEVVPDGATILVAPGTYSGRVNLKRVFDEGIVIVSAVPYQARLRHFNSVVTCYFCQGVTLEGFDIAHLVSDADRYVIQIQDLSEDRSGGRRVTLRNNVLHDSYNNDILKINNGADQVLVEGNIFYNQAGPDSHIDINSATNVIVQDNIFFNDFAGSGRQILSTASFIVVKDSNGEEDANLGSRNIFLRRNIFLNWQGKTGSAFIVIGEDKVPYFQAYDVLIENNLLLGNSGEVMRAAFMAKGVRDIIFRHNTIVGDLPSRAYAIRLDIQESNPINENLFFYNNIWSDPTGTMGESNRLENGGFADVPFEALYSFKMANNLYWNGNSVIPYEADEAINYTDDTQRIIADPELPTIENVVLPRWLPSEGRFADGSMTITEAFEGLVMAYGATALPSPVIDAADASHAAEEDILGQPRSIPDIGAYEFPDQS